MNMFKPLIEKTKTKTGLNVSMSIIDMIYVLKKRQLRVLWRQ
jgi:hypothetical protein